MFKDIVRLSRHTLVYGIGNILSRSLGFILLPLYVNFIIPAEYGKAVTLFAYLAFFNVIFLYGMDTSFLRFYILRDAENKPKETFSTAFMSLTVTTIIFCLIIFIFRENITQLIFNNQAMKDLILLAIVIVFFDTLSVLPFLVLRAEERSKQFVFLKFLTIAVNLSLNILLVAVYRTGIKGIFISNAISSLLSFIFVFNIVISKFRLKFSKNVYREMLKFGLPYIFPGISIICMEVIDRIIIEKYLGFGYTGIYGAAYKLAMIMSLVVASFRFAWHPFFLSIAKREDARNIYSKIMTYYLYLTLWVFLAFSLFIPEIVKIKINEYTFFTEEYQAGVFIVPYILFDYLLYGVYVNFIVGIYLKKKSGYLPFITGISALINIVLNVLLIPKIGILGSAIATTVAYGIMALILYIIVRRIYYIPYEWYRIFKLLLVTFFLYLLNSYIIIGNEIVTKSIITLCFPFLLILTFFYDKDEISKIKKIIKTGF